MLVDEVRSVCRVVPRFVDSVRRLASLHRENGPLAEATLIEFMRVVADEPNTYHELRHPHRPLRNAGKGWARLEAAHSNEEHAERRRILASIATAWHDLRRYFRIQSRKAAAAAAAADGSGLDNSATTHAAAGGLSDFDDPWEHALTWTLLHEHQYQIHRREQLARRKRAALTAVNLMSTFLQECSTAVRQLNAQSSSIQREMDERVYEGEYLRQLRADDGPDGGRGGGTSAAAAPTSGERQKALLRRINAALLDRDMNVDTLFETIDAGGDGRLTFAELCHGFGVLRLGFVDDDARTIFDMLDSNQARTRARAPLTCERTRAALIRVARRMAPCRCRSSRRRCATPQRRAAGSRGRPRLLVAAAGTRQRAEQARSRMGFARRCVLSPPTARAARGPSLAARHRPRRVPKSSPHSTIRSKISSSTKSTSPRLWLLSMCSTDALRVSKGTSGCARATSKQTSRARRRCFARQRLRPRAPLR